MSLELVGVKVSRIVEKPRVAGLHAQVAECAVPDPDVLRLMQFAIFLPLLLNVILPL